MNFGAATKSRVRHFDLTPMIDVVLQLIIFFMFTSQFGELTRTEIDLPREAGESAAPGDKPTFEIDMRRDGSLLVESLPISVDEVLGLVRAEVERAGSPDPVSVRSRPDRACPALHLNRLTERLVGLGVRRWSIGTIDPGGAP